MRLPDTLTEPKTLEWFGEMVVTSPPDPPGVTPVAASPLVKLVWGRLASFTVIFHEFFELTRSQMQVHPVGVVETVAGAGPAGSTSWPMRNPGTEQNASEILTTPVLASTWGDPPEQS